MSHTLSCPGKSGSQRGNRVSLRIIVYTPQFYTFWEAGRCHALGRGALDWKWGTWVWFLPVFWFCYMTSVRFLLLWNGTVQLGDLRYFITSKTFPHIFLATSNPEVCLTDPGLLCKVSIISISLAGKSCLNNLILILGFTNNFKRDTRWKFLLQFSWHACI